MVKTEMTYTKSDEMIAETFVGMNCKDSSAKRDEPADIRAENVKENREK